MNDEYKSMVEQLVIYRHEEKLSQEDLAAIIGVTNSLVHKWEQYKRIPSGSCCRVGLIHLVAKSKSLKSRMETGTATCEACYTKTEWFVAMLHSYKPTKHYIICLNCYERDTWQTTISQRELTMKNGSANGSKKSASKTTASPSQVRSEVSGQETSISQAWWDES